MSWTPPPYSPAVVWTNTAATLLDADNLNADTNGAASYAVSIGNSVITFLGSTGSNNRLLYSNGLYPPRPSAATSVEWIGPVDPAVAGNISDGVSAAQNGDTWINNS